MGSLLYSMLTGVSNGYKGIIFATGYDKDPAFYMSVAFDSHWNKLILKLQIKVWMASFSKSRGLFTTDFP
jgi:hypothetical protein